MCSQSLLRIEVRQARDKISEFPFHVRPKREWLPRLTLAKATAKNPAEFAPGAVAKMPQQTVKAFFVHENRRFFLSAQEPQLTLLRLQKDPPYGQREQHP